MITSLKRGVDESWGLDPVKVLITLFSVVVVGFSLAPPGRAASTNYLGAGTRSMARRLEEVARKTNPDHNPYLSRQRADLAKSRLARTKDPDEQFDLTLSLSKELLNAGDNEGALTELEKLPSMFQERGLWATNKSFLLLNKAVAYLRIGELENCLTNHNADSCLFPVEGGGVHKLQRGSRAAIQVLTNLLTEAPQDLSARWLLNIAFMTLGEYPGNVPPAWLIPPQTFQSQHPMPRFPDVAAQLGLDLNGLSGGAILEDFNGDGFLDVMMSDIGLNAQLRFFLNNGGGTFTERTEQAGLLGEVGGLNIIQTDYNNDGFPDVLVLRGAWWGRGGRHPLSLLRNNGNGTFDDVTEEAGLLRFHPTQTAVWLDFNNDGWLDLFVGNESVGREIHACELYRNNRDGTFTECALESGVAFRGFVKGVTAGDFNNDGRTDLYLSIMGGPNVLYRNDGAAKGSGGKSWRFTNVAAAAGVTEPFYSFPTWFFDYDNDGWPDLFVAGFHISFVGDVAADYLGLPHTAQRSRLYHNNHDGTFSDVTKSAGLDKVLLAMGSNFGDLDNDGFLDFYLGTGNPDLSTLIPNRMFRNDSGRRFQEVTSSGGFGHLQKGHGVSFGDIDNDGDQDVLEKMGGGYSGDVAHSVLYLNPGTSNHWITIKLEGAQSNRPGIGSRIKLITRGPQGRQTIYRTAGTGGSFGANPLRQEIGLGQAQIIERLEIFWPVTGRTNVYQNLEVDQFVQAREDQSELTPLSWKSFKIEPVASHSHHHEH